jgi:formylglycine-generating enzyme required for sulfatase activity
MGKTEVTVGAFKKFAAERGIPMPPEVGRNKNWAQTELPMTNVSLEEAKNYCQWIGGHLPSEAEWEYAAKGGDPKQLYPFAGANPKGLVASGGAFLTPVGQFPANAFGLRDMAGNASELVAEGVAKGGNFQGSPKTYQITYRYQPGAKEVRMNATGFRCAW